jgi:peptidoglycan/LPS O-acetylase OafA/YrhL
MNYSDRTNHERNGPSRLDSLTSLRFLAAFTIIMRYPQELLPSSNDRGPTARQRCVVLFVLSGFLLAYAYPTLPDESEIWRFLIARVAGV